MNQTTLMPTWWARHPSRQIFDVGPFPSEADATNDAAEMMGLEIGERFEIGTMKPFIPEAPLAIDHLQSTIRFGYRDHSRAIKWASELPKQDDPEALELQRVLDLALLGWMTAHGLVPTFGFMETFDVYEVVVGGAKRLGMGNAAGAINSNIPGAKYAVLAPQGSAPAWDFYDERGHMLNWHCLCTFAPKELLEGMRIKVCANTEQVFDHIPL